MEPQKPPLLEYSARDSEPKPWVEDGERIHTVYSIIWLIVAMLFVISVIGTVCSWFLF